jgi:hypothetical protein
VEHAALLSPADVTVIRKYVRTKYAEIPEAKRSEIVAAAVLQTIRRRLPDVPEPLKAQLAEKLIRRCLVGEQRPICPEDVLEVCLSMDASASGWATQMVEPILQWMKERAPEQDQLETWKNRLLDKQALFAGRLAESETVPPDPMESVACPDAKAFATARKLRMAPKTGLAWSAMLLTFVFGIWAGLWIDEKAYPDNLPDFAVEADVAISESSPIPLSDSGMPSDLRYHDFDVDAVKSYLAGRDSLLAEEPYFSAIVASAKAHDVHPLLLFAIAGQEQGFVPKSHKYATRIANNPFNVFHSWERFNTNIAESSDIAARTIARQGSKRPEGFDPFEWLNQTYAEDPNWSGGVRRIFEKLQGLSSPTEAISVSVSPNP